jgi:hypothetical protein
MFGQWLGERYMPPANIVLCGCPLTAIVAANYGVEVVRNRYERSSSCGSYACLSSLREMGYDITGEDVDQFVVGVDMSPGDIAKKTWRMATTRRGHEVAVALGFRPLWSHKS